SCGFVAPSMQAGPQRSIPEGVTFVDALPDIKDFIDKTYRTIAKKSSRAVAGLSMGGFYTIAVSKEYPDWFDYMGVFSAGLRLPDEAQAKAHEEAQFKKQFSKHPKLYWIGCGKTDFLYGSTVYLREYFDSKGYPYTYYESEGGHIWRNWRIYLSEYAPLLFK
ncbi:MAG: esterase, partial [Bacteroidales bacterium]|nr:esterase [Bacteroidales bacterium]